MLKRRVKPSAKPPARSATRAARGPFNWFGLHSLLEAHDRVWHKTCVMSFRVSAFYKFTPFEDPEAIREIVLSALSDCGALGTVLVAGEGINGTIAAEGASLDTAMAALTALPGCEDLEWKESPPP